MQPRGELLFEHPKELPALARTRDMIRPGDSLPVAGGGQGPQPAGLTTAPSFMDVSSAERTATMSGGHHEKLERRGRGRLRLVSPGRSLLLANHGSILKFIRQEEIAVGAG